MCARVMNIGVTESGQSVSYSQFAVGWLNSTLAPPNDNAWGALLPHAHEPPRIRAAKPAMQHSLLQAASHSRMWQSMVRPVTSNPWPAQVAIAVLFIKLGLHPGCTQHVSAMHPWPWADGARCVGRPVDVLQMPDGALLVSDDQLGAVYRISYEEPMLTPTTTANAGK